MKTVYYWSGGIAHHGETVYFDTPEAANAFRETQMKPRWEYDTDLERIGDMHRQQIKSYQEAYGNDNTYVKSAKEQMRDSMTGIRNMIDEGMDSYLRRRTGDLAELQVYEADQSEWRAWMSTPPAMPTY